MTTDATIAQQRLVDGLNMLLEVRPHVRESGEQKLSAAVTEFQGALEGYIAAAKVRPEPPATVAELVRQFDSQMAAFTAMKAGWSELLDKAKEAHAAAATGLPGR